MSAIDRRDILNALKSMFLADTTILNSALNPALKVVSVKQQDYEKSKVDIENYSALYLKGGKRTWTSRQQNSDYDIDIPFRIEVLAIDQDAAYDILEAIDDRMQELISEQVYSGLNFSTDINNLKSQIYNIEYLSSEPNISIENGQSRAHCEGTILFNLNRRR